MKESKIERQEREMRERWASGEPVKSMKSMKSGTPMKVYKVPCPLHPDALAYASDRAHRCIECRKAWRQAHPDQIGMKQQYNSFKTQVIKYRGGRCELTFEQYTDIVNQPCVYAIHRESGIRIGIDQKIAKDGYTQDNSVPCCYRHNMMKSNIFTYDQAREIARVYGIRCGNHPGRKKTRNQPVRNRVRATSVRQPFASIFP